MFFDGGFDLELFEREDALLLFLGDEDLLFELEEVGAMASMTQTWCDLLIRHLTVSRRYFSLALGSAQSWRCVGSEGYRPRFLANAPSSSPLRM